MPLTIDPEKTVESEELMRRYMSSPAEYNAHFQQAMTEVERALQQVSKKKLAIMTFYEFIAFAEKNSKTVEKFSLFDDKYSRKWLSRMYQTWEYLVEKARS
jgi:hypothetical protein